MQLEDSAIEYPKDFEESVQTTTAEFKQQIRVMAALKMFELGKLSSGRAAELAGQSRSEFFDTCARYKVSIFNYADDDVAQEIRKELESARELRTQ